MVGVSVGPDVRVTVIVAVGGTRVKVGVEVGGANVEVWVGVWLDVAVFMGANVAEGAAGFSPMHPAARIAMNTRRNNLVTSCFSIKANYSHSHRLHAPEETGCAASSR
jgi:hypothetical protein